MFTENKISEFQNKISELADRPQMSAQALKAYFDGSAEEIRQKYNALVDALDAFAAGSFDAVSYSAADGKLTFTFGDGSTQVIDLPLELLVKSGHYDAEKQSIVLTLANEDVLEIPVSDLVNEYEADEKTLHMTPSEVSRIFSVKDGVFAPEAPSDNKVYARKDGKWKEIIEGLPEITLAEADTIADGLYVVTDACGDWAMGTSENPISKALLIVGTEGYDGGEAKQQLLVLPNGELWRRWDMGEWQSVIPSLAEYATRTYVDEQNTDKWDELVNVTLTENLATEFRQVFEKRYKRIRFKLVFTGASTTTLSSVRFKRAKADGSGSPQSSNYLKYFSSGNLGTKRYLSGTVSFDVDGDIIITDGASVNATAAIGSGATFGGGIAYNSAEQYFPEFYMYLGGSIAEDGTPSGNVLGAGTKIQVWGCEK